MARAGRPVQFYLDDDKLARLRAMAEASRRTLTAEIELAIDRHMAYPPVVSLPEAAADVEPAARRPRGRPPKAKPAEPEPAQPKRPRGRPKKGSA